MTLRAADSCEDAVTFLWGGASALQAGLRPARSFMSPEECVFNGATYANFRKQTLVPIELWGISPKIDSQLVLTAIAGSADTLYTTTRAA
ncbi:MAG TPA: hypothetical protein VHY84_09705 [Bryobacteraceae bacterium]|jgi:hypothetical protein|nr:hypothetical protein [Bryobacteraceae bacterium]